MSHPEGTYLGGIRTVEDLRQRCRIDPDTGCWHWGLAIVQGYPKVHFVTPEGKRVSMRGRRAALYLRRGRDLPKGKMAFPADQCRAVDCVNPAHARFGDRLVHGEYLKRTGKAKSPRKTAANKAIARAKRAKITSEQAAEIRHSEESTYALARKYGIAQSAIWSIKKGRSWLDTLPTASVFSLGATV